MITNLVRTRATQLIQPLARFLGNIGLTPNAVTVLGFLLTGAVAVFMALTGQLRLSGGLLIFTLAADGIDGALARLSGNVSRFGAFLDSTLDRWAEVFIYGALVWHYLKLEQDSAVLLATAAMATSLLVSYTRARAEGAGIMCREGLLTRFERMVILIAGLLFDQTIWALRIIAVLGSFTAVQRIWVTWQMDQQARQTA